MNILFTITGGIGKCIAGTAVAEAIKKQYPDLTDDEIEELAEEMQPQQQEQTQQGGLLAQALGS